MWHQVSQVAKTHRFNEKVFLNFAAENVDRFSLIQCAANPVLQGGEDVNAEGDSLMVNTWNADSLVEQFKQQILITIPANADIGS